MPRNLILSGGVAHDFPATSTALAGVLAEIGMESEITEDVAGALAVPAPVDLITVNAFRWRMDGDDFAEERDRWRFQTPDSLRRTLLDHLARGGGLLAVHTASLCFDDWPEWAEILGGAWRWGTSYHPPIGRAKVRLGTGHPIVDGLADFEVTDEVYTDLDVLPDVEPLAYSGDQPLLWARTAAGGRVVYDALGHDTRSYENPVRRTLLRRVARWLLGS
ncbi:ThuA domain-containing protein [Microbispora sp. NEAU-D428]|uniref:ThuA domain-containing protein n=1 Tax=Microbispora sitophila TaxID=2771537 RepID=UPI00186743EE|nr:ThuA domain-containing protein [Microbispora sitophila]MBE3010249.1 ThuA domain-containing protein [Microbispora sitophila]